MTTWRIARCITNAANPHSEYVIRIALPLQPRSQERVSILGYTYTACLVKHNSLRQTQIMYSLRVRSPLTPQ